MSQKILITAALPYANGPLHFGHIAGSYLNADCYARFQRMQGHDVLFICGSDEYGVAITLSAEMAGRTPREHVELFHNINKKLFQQLEISFDHYSRTTWPGHVAPVHQYFLDLVANGYIEEKVTDQLFSVADNRFLADRYVIGTCPKCHYEQARGDECPKCGASYEATDLINPRSKISNAPLSRKPTKHWFLMLDKFKETLSTWIQEKHWKPNVLNFAKNYIDELRPRAITRDSEWGVPVPLPNAEGKVLYVWFEACIGYISSAMEWAQLQGKPDLWKDYWCDPSTKLVQFMGKDNIPFHAILLPAMTMGQNQPYKVVDALPANEFYNLEGKKINKSEGWYIDMADFLTRYSAEQLRYTLAVNAPETADSEFTWKDFQQRCNSELLGKYGNLANRTLVFAQKYCDGQIPSIATCSAEDQALLDHIQQLAQEAARCYEGFKLRQACQTIMELAAAGNAYFDAKKPWQAAKAAETRPAMETTIACCLECLKVLAIISYPIIPQTAERLWSMLGLQEPLTAASWPQQVKTPLQSGTALPPPAILFTKVEDTQIAAEIAKLKVT
jgi:methionyl-tRNA synthetase